MRENDSLKSLHRLVGSWTTEATHPAFPGLIVHGSAEVEWLEGEKFLIHRARTEHPDFPDSIAIIGFTECDRVEDDARSVPADEQQRLRMNYFDSRGVSRIYDAHANADSWGYQRMAPGFSQRFSGRFGDDGNTITGLSQLCQDDQNWHDDLAITYRRKA